MFRCAWKAGHVEHSELAEPNTLNENDVFFGSFMKQIRLALRF
jgi:hypothetical protein